MRKRLSKSYVPQPRTTTEVDPNGPGVLLQAKLPTTVDIELDPVEIRRAHLHLDPPTHVHNPFDFLNDEMWVHMFACLDWLGRTDKRYFMVAKQMTGMARQLRDFLGKHSIKYMEQYDADNG